MRFISRILAIIFAPVFGVISFMGQVGPKQAMANYAEWYTQYIGTPPSWISSHAADIFGSLIAAILAIACLIWFFWPWIEAQRNKLKGKKDDEKTSGIRLPLPTQRMPFIDLLREAEKRGLSFLGDNPTILNLCKELRQAASDGTLQIWGRVRRESDPLIPIPAIHWREFSIDWTQAVVMGPPSGEIKGFAGDNFFVGTNTLDHKKAYFDLHVDRTRALELIELLPWKNQPGYFVWVAAYLWVNQKPVEGKLGPNSVAYPKLQMIKGCIESGKIKSLTGGAGANDRVSSEELKKIASERKEFPKFLFPD